MDFFSRFMSSADFIFKINFFQIFLSGIPFECQSDWIRPDVFFLAWAQSACKGYEQTILEGNELRTGKMRKWRLLLDGALRVSFWDYCTLMNSLYAGKFWMLHLSSAFFFLFQNFKFQNFFLGIQLKGQIVWWHVVGPDLGPYCLQRLCKVKE